MDGVIYDINKWSNHCLEELINFSWSCSMPTSLSSILFLAHVFTTSWFVLSGNDFVYSYQAIGTTSDVSTPSYWRYVLDHVAWCLFLLCIQWQIVNNYIVFMLCSLFFHCIHALAYKEINYALCRCSCMWYEPIVISTLVSNRSPHLLVHPSLLVVWCYYVWSLYAVYLYPKLKAWSHISADFILFIKSNCLDSLH